MIDEPGTAIGANTLLEKLRDRISRDGPLTVADYMAACLADPDYGYYVTRDPLGARGDFITAPEISQVFGELIGAWAAIVWQDMGSPSPFRLVELGPGRGTLMTDLLRATRSVPDFGDAAEINLVEISPALRAVQEKTLEPYAGRISWHEGMEAVPGGAMIVVANEFLDALPVRQFVLIAGEWHERCVVAGDDGGLGFGTGNDPVRDPEIIPETIRHGAKDGDIAEVSPAFETYVSTLADKSNGSSLAALFIDYGHEKSAPGDTFQAVRGHDYADPLRDPGRADLTAHVDFERLGNLARSAGLAVHGPMTQGAFLKVLGIEERTALLLKGANDEQARQLVSGAQRLAEPDKMGQLFKVMALTSPELIPPPFDLPV